MQTYLYNIAFDDMDIGHCVYWTPHQKFPQPAAAAEERVETSGPLEPGEEEVAGRPQRWRTRNVEEVIEEQLQLFRRDEWQVGSLRFCWIYVKISLAAKRLDPSEGADTPGCRARDSQHLQRGLPGPHRLAGVRQFGAHRSLQVR